MKYNNLYIILSFLFLYFFHANNCYSQIRLSNPGFEDTPADATIPKTWLGCEEGTTPDILPGFWGEYGDAAEGETYVGLITRPDGSFESIGQKLPNAVKKGECHQFSLYLSKGSVYAGFNKALKLRVWLGEDKCAKDQMIFLSPEIRHSDWKMYKIEFTPNANYQYIRLEAFYQEGDFSYKGNILMDGISTILQCKRV